MTPQQALQLLTDIIAETIRDATRETPMQGIPSGHLYAAVMSVCPLHVYNAVIERLKQDGKVAERYHVLTWIACPGCTKGDCYGHVAEYLDAAGNVRQCKCSDPRQHHGKLRPRQTLRTDADYYNHGDRDGQ